MRGAGCTWNDITDRDLDGKVERTRSRPIPAGQVTRDAGAGLRWSLQALVGLVVLLQFNRFAMLRPASPRFVIVAIYPFMKRITWWPQIVLGLAFSWGALMGFAVTFGRHRADRAGALCRIDRLGDRLRHHLCASGPRGRRADRRQVDRAACSASTPIQALVALLWAGGGADRRGAGLRWCGLVAWLGLAAFAAHLAWQIRRLDIDDPAAACGCSSRTAMLDCCCSQACWSDARDADCVIRRRRIAAFDRPPRRDDRRGRPSR